MGTTTLNNVRTVPAPETRAISTSEASRLRNAGVSSMTFTTNVLVMRWAKTMPHQE